MNDYSDGDCIAFAELIIGEQERRWELLAQRSKCGRYALITRRREVGWPEDVCAIDLVEQRVLTKAERNEFFI